MRAKPLSFAIGLAMLVIIAIIMVKGGPNTTLLDIKCTGEEIKDVYIGNDADLYSQNVGTTLDDLGSQTPKAGPSYYTEYKTSQGHPFVYGFSSCTITIGEENCASCLEVARSSIQGCDGKVGAHSIHVDCTIRYENVYFKGFSR